MISGGNMANILQVTNTPVTPDRGVTDPQKAGGSEKNQQIQNPVDPTRVVRADGRNTENTKDAMTEDGYAVIDYESNFGTFLKKISEGGLEPFRLMEQMFLKEGAKALFGDFAETDSLIERLMSSFHIETPEKLFSFLKEQTAAQAKFSGPFFDSFRNIFKGNAPEGIKEAALVFLRAYNDYSSGGHFLNQMRIVSGDIRQLLLRGFQEEFDQILKDMNWEAKNGDTEMNTALLNGRLIPFLSNYISRTHDYGAVRDAAMLFIFFAVRYENGSLERLNQIFRRLMGTVGSERFFSNQTELGDLLKEAEKGGTDKEFADAFAGLMQGGISGKAGLENIQPFYDALDRLLLNESVYMQVLHMLVPFDYQGKKVASEFWLDPDAENQNPEGGRCMKLLLKFSIEGTGAFELFLNFQDRNVDMRLQVPEPFMENENRIQKEIADIFKKNGITAKNIIIEGNTTDMRVEDVFPELLKRGRGINVRI